MIDAALEVRDWNTISLKPEGPLHLWEMAAELFKKYKTQQPSSEGFLIQEKK